MKNNITKNLKQNTNSSKNTMQILFAFGILLFIFIPYLLISKHFMSGINLSNLLRQIAPIIIIGIGQSYVLISGHIDLSLGSVIGMSVMISSHLMTMNKEWNAFLNPWGILIVTMAACLLLGLINGVLVAKFKLPSYIITLATMSIARGIAQAINRNYSTDAIGAQADGFRELFYRGEIFSIGEGRKAFTLYNTVIIALVIWLVFYLLLKYTRFGRDIYATGSNIDAARLSGVNTTGAIIKAYLVSAFCAGLVGLIACATAGMGAMDSGNMYETYAFVISIIGGVSILGGRGSLVGTLIGAFIWGTLLNVIHSMGASVAVRNIVIGTLLIIFAGFNIISNIGILRKKIKSSLKL